MSITRRILELDELDAEAINKALRLQFSFGDKGLPDGEGNLPGRMLAEICRGWLEYMGEGVGEEQAT